MVTVPSSGGLIGTLTPGAGTGLVQSAGLGPDLNVWFTAWDTAGEPFQVTAGSDGNVWFTENSTGRIGKISLPGVSAVVRRRTRR